MALHTHYDSLQVKRDASLDAIKGAYRYLSQKWHPDKQPPSNRAEAERITKQLTSAYEVLSDPVARITYDEWIEEQETHHDDGTAAREDPQPASSTLSAYERVQMSERIAAAFWPGAIAGATFSLFLLFVLVAQIDAAKQWSERHPVIVTLALLAAIIFSARSAIEQRAQKVRSANDDESLAVLFRYTSRTKTLITTCATVVGLAAAPIILSSMFNESSSSSSPSVQPAQTSPSLASTESLAQQAPQLSEPAKPTTLTSTYKRVYADVDCGRPIMLGLRYLQDYKRILGIWQAKANSRDTALFNDRALLKVPADDVFFFAMTTDGAYVWAGSGNDTELLEFEGKTRRFARVPVTDAPHIYIRLSCNEPSR
ncbi:J domain-containing protein [Pigmentiphaga kullae]|uniref:DnaJ-like protein n=1 Tax=Pigmentiphaga kullae TaxID=151784 RepID=A0A4Q7NHK0_9BURK|nr:J domain-containing protein [Pigmentiphaga kullae]RZS84222.1 DnaJ-like protein [Pigmentiphaga kullae]